MDGIDDLWSTQLPNFKNCGVLIGTATSPVGDSTRTTFSIDRTGTSSGLDSVVPAELERRVFWRTGMTDSLSTEAAKGVITATRWAAGMRDRKLLVALDILTVGGSAECSVKECTSVRADRS